MPRRQKIKIDWKRDGAVQRLVNPVENSYHETQKLVTRMKKPPKPLRRFWPNI